MLIGPGANYAWKLPLDPSPLFLRPRNLRRFYDPLSSLPVILFHALTIALASHQLEQREEIIQRRKTRDFLGKVSKFVRAPRQEGGL